MTMTLVAQPMATGNSEGDSRTVATLAFVLGLWATCLGVINLVYGAYGTPENKLKVVWAAYLSMGTLYPDLYTADMVYRPASDSVFMILSLGLTIWGGKQLHDSTEGGIAQWFKDFVTCDSWLSLMSMKEAGGRMTAAMWCLVTGGIFYIYQGIEHWNWVDVGVYSVTASLLGFGCALMFAAKAENQE
jgi:hypothetical protein